MLHLPAGIAVAAPPAAVWEYLTTGSNFATWCPEWKAPANAKIHLTRVGDVVKLAPLSNGTVVQFWEQYTDESSPADLEATATKMQSEFVANLAALKNGIEKK